MALHRLRPGLTVLRRGPGEVQVGTDPRWSVALGDLSPAAVRGLLAVPDGAGTRVVRACLAAEDVAAVEADAVVAHLVAARLLVPEPTTAPRPVPPAAAPDLRAWSLVEADGDGAAVLARRAASHVHLMGLGRLGATLAGLLAAAGVGTVGLEDDAPTLPEHVGGGVLLGADVGRTLAVATAHAVLARDPGDGDAHGSRCRTPVGPAELDRRPPDLVVLVEHHVADPVRHRPLQDRGIAHLSVVLREASVLVGPLVVPRGTPCLHCVDLARTAVDPRWPTVAAQLAVHRGARAHVEEATLATLGAATACLEVLHHLDGRPGSMRGATVEIALPAGLPARTTWLPHPGCGCGSQVVEPP